MVAVRDPLNFFSPYERLQAGHENQLTRALLLMLRLSPLAHIEWLSLVCPDRALRTLSVATFDTQKRALRSPRDEIERTELISVFLAPEQPQSADGDVVMSDRGQVLDGIINYGDELIVAVENKVFEAGDAQARLLNLHGMGIVLVEGQQVVVVLWRELLEAFIGLRERELVAGAERAVVDDFLTYVEDHFPALGPFRNLALCRGVRGRVHRRLRQVLGEAAHAEAEGSQYGPRVQTPAGTVAGRDAYLKLADAGYVEFAMYPADTLGQAREFYSRAGTVDGVRALSAADGWVVSPNFHFGHVQRGFAWTTSEIALGDYLDFWREQIAEAGNVPRHKWDEYWAWLVAAAVATAADRPSFDRAFTETERQTATPRPGLELTHRWTLLDAEALDASGAFVTAVREVLTQALTALVEPPLSGP